MNTHHSRLCLGCWFVRVFLSHRELAWAIIYVFFQESCPRAPIQTVLWERYPWPRSQSVRTVLPAPEKAFLSPSSLFRFARDFPTFSQKTTFCFLLIFFS